MTMTPISQLRFYPGNARRGDIDLIAESLKKLGQFAPVIVNRGNKSSKKYKSVLLSGNHTTMAAQRLGWEEIDVHWVDVDDDAAIRINLVANKANDEATYEVEELVNLLTELPDLEATGFDRDELDAMLEALDDLEEEVPDKPKDPKPDGFNLLVECDTAEEQQRIKSRLLAEGVTISEV